ncbi:MAG: hypothetical protein HOO67_05310 [Candidatus Peribacteraceae bacterium]|nr:hypothetical protein [Candidatus Peribacteraceae bacterium]
MSLPIRILLRFLLTIGLVWAMNTYLHTWFVVTGGIPAYVIIAALITLMNIFVAPVLNLLAAPLKFFMTFVAVLLVNWIFLWLTIRIVSAMEPTLVTMQIKGGIPGWIVVIIALGVGKLVMKLVLK